MSGAPDPYAAFSAPVDADPYGSFSSPASDPQKRSWMDDVTGFMSKVNRGLGVGDELAAAGKTAADIVTGRSGPNVVQTYKDELAGQRATEDSYAAAHPHLAALATGTGNALTLAAPIGPGAEAFSAAVPLVGEAAIPAGRAINALRGATLGGLTASGYAAVDRGSLRDRVRAATDPVTLGAGAGLGGAGGALAGKAPTIDESPSLDALTAQKKDAYDAVDASGVRYDPEAMNTLLVGMANDMDKQGFHAGLHGKAATMLDKIGGSVQQAGGYSPTLSELDQLRQEIGRDVASSPDKGERKMGSIMRAKIDGFINSAGPEDIVGASDPAAAAELIAHARDLNTRVEKMRALDNLDEHASDRASVTGSGGNINNTTRQNALRFKNQVDNLTPDEQAATQRIIDGTPTGNALRQLGKLSPEGNGLMMLAHGATTTAELASGHSPMAVAQGGLALAGAISKRVADAMTEGNVQALRNLIARGGKATAEEVSRQLAAMPAADDLRLQLANDLSVAAGVEGSAHRSPVQVESVFDPRTGKYLVGGPSPQ